MSPPSLELPFSLPQSSSSPPFSAAHYSCPPLTLLSIDLASQGSPNSHPSEELLKQPDYSDKIKQMLGKQGQRRVGGHLRWSWGSRGISAWWEGKTRPRASSARLVFEGQLATPK